MKLSISVITRGDSGKIDFIGDFGGYGFNFVVDFIKQKNAYGRFITLTDEEAEFLLDNAISILKSDNYGDLSLVTYGLMGFAQMMALKGFFRRLGYDLVLLGTW